MNLKQVSTDGRTTLAEKVDGLKKEHIILIQARTEIYSFKKYRERADTVCLEGGHGQLHRGSHD